MMDRLRDTNFRGKVTIGRTYGYGNLNEMGMFRGKRALLSLITGGPEEAYRR